MARQEPVTRWRSMTWAADLLERSGLKPDELELQLYDVIKTVEERTPAGIIRDYLSGRRATNFESARKDRHSLILTAETLYPGSMWSYCDPLFDALDEALYWENEPRARAKFLDRMGAERRSAARQRSKSAYAEVARESSGLSDAEIDDMIWSCTLGQLRDIASTRIRRIRAAMLAMPSSYRLDMFYRAPARDGGFCRALQPIAVELAVVSEPYKREHVALCSLLMLEALALEDFDRWVESAEQLCSLRSALPSLFSSRQVAEEIWSLLATCMRAFGFPRYPPSLLRSKRTYAHIHTLDRIQDSEAMNALLTDVEAYGMPTGGSRRCSFL